MEKRKNPNDKVAVGAEEGRLTFDVLEGALAVEVMDRTETSE